MVGRRRKFPSFGRDHMERGDEIKLTIVPISPFFYALKACMKVALYFSWYSGLSLPKLMMSGVWL